MASAKKNTASQRNHPKPGASDFRRAEWGYYIRPGVLGSNPRFENPAVPSYEDRVGAKPYDITPNESGSGRG